MMVREFTATGSPIELVKAGMGTPLQSFGIKVQGFSALWKELLSTLVGVGIAGYFFVSALACIGYFGMDYCLGERKAQLIGTVVFAVLVAIWMVHFAKLFATKAEIFAKGFYLKHGNKEYAYAFKEIAHLQKILFKGTDNNISSAGLTLFLTSGEELKIFGNWTEVLVGFIEAVALAYVQSKEQDVKQQFKKGERIWFWLIEIDKHHVYFGEKQILWLKISEVKRAMADRYLLVLDQDGKKIAKWDLNKIWDEELFVEILEQIRDSRL